MELADWIEGYRRAWEQNDADLLQTLFTEDASYRSSPFREPPNLGHEGVVAYWTGATSSQEDVQVEIDNRPAWGRPTPHGGRRCRAGA